MEKPRILFLHNKCMRYTKPLFNILAERLNVYFFFTDEKKIDGLKAGYSLSSKCGFGLFKPTRGLMLALFREKCDLIVLPPADSPGELFDNLICFLAAKIRNKPYVIWSERWGWKKGRKSPIRRLYLALDQTIIGYIYRNANACISDGIKHKEYLISLNVSGNRIFIAPRASVIGPNSDDEETSRIKDGLGLGDKKIILYVGRLIKRKGVNYLIEAFAKIRKEIDGVSLLIIGGEGLYGKTTEDRFSIDQLKCYSEELGLKLNHDIFFLGDVDDKTLLHYYTMSNVFVLPGVTFLTGEPWGLVLNEAMQFEKPVISTDAVGAAYDLIEVGKNGFMIPERDSGALSGALFKVLSDSGLQEKMGMESKRIISRYKYEDMFNGFEKAINYALRFDNEDS